MFSRPIGLASRGCCVAHGISPKLQTSGPEPPPPRHVAGGPTGPLAPASTWAPDGVGHGWQRPVGRGGARATPGLEGVRSRTGKGGARGLPAAGSWPPRPCPGCPSACVTPLGAESARLNTGSTGRAKVELAMHQDPRFESLAVFSSP